jgi:hypothetical protein
LDQTYERWVLNYYPMRSTVLAAIPWPVQVVVGLLIYRKVTRNLQGQGTLILTDEEISSFRQDIWEHLNVLVTAAHAKHANREGPFWVWGGQSPSEADAVLFGFIASGLVCDAYVFILSFGLFGPRADVLAPRRLATSFGRILLC